MVGSRVLLGQALQVLSRAGVCEADVRRHFACLRREPTPIEAVGALNPDSHPEI